MRTIHIINGPNLNLLGVRDPEIYGTTPFEEYLERLRDLYSAYDIVYYQSNHEGDLIDYLQGDEVRMSGGVILNAGAYSHYSLALADAIQDLPVPVVEVHISNLAKREDIRKKSLISPYCEGVLMGFGLDGYRLAIAHLIARR
ncbi:MAG: type II 3-dehydroquinate dehydratase [Porphyromonas sp.]|nr:type II 3-dehydroquinate dehydratase [Porphyromonas sp.]